MLQSATRRHIFTCSLLTSPAASRLTHISLRHTSLTTTTTHTLLTPTASFHSPTARFNPAASSSKPPSNSSFDDDNLFEEEEAIARNDSPMGKSRLTSLLTDTRRVTQAHAAAHAAALSEESESASLKESLKLLDEKNPPKLLPKHMKLLHAAVRDLEKKLATEQRREELATPGVSPPMNPNIEQLEKTLALCRGLVSQLFPPTIPNVPFDENATADILDYAESMPGVLNVMTPDAVDPMKLMSVDHRTTRKNRHLYCLFCKPSTATLEKNQLVYTNVNLLTQFVNERGMILQRAESRLCHIHQRKLSRTIKQSRSIGLMSPSSNWRVDQEFVYGVGSKEFNPNNFSSTSTGSTGGSLSTSGGKSAVFGSNDSTTPSSTAKAATTFQDDLYDDDEFDQLDRDIHGNRRK